jgi:UDPglucose--hexose-1-phosphate uridylyltransferase
LKLAAYPHRRKNILTGEWILVSPQRAKRPWQGQQEAAEQEKKPEYDPTCYLCPGNARAGGHKNPTYESTFIFDNDFSALQPDTPDQQWNLHNLIIADTEPGRCRVLCFSPRHDLTLPEMTSEAVAKVIDVWQAEYAVLGADQAINYVQIFENKGSIMGCSNPHPHGQIWAQKQVPVEPAKEMLQFTSYFQSHGCTMLADYLSLELQQSDRLVWQNEHFVALVPFWATWPFETMIISRRAVAGLDAFYPREKQALADILRIITIKYDNLFQISFPYSMGLHQAPTDGLMHPEWHFHIHFYPPLLRSATIRKFMVGYEMLANPQRDITAELSAERLRESPEKHYKGMIKQPKSTR